MYASDTVNIIKFRDSSSGITNQYHHHIQQFRYESLRKMGKQLIFYVKCHAFFYVYDSDREALVLA